jgi:hypothetical protein
MTRAQFYSKLSTPLLQTRLASAEKELANHPARQFEQENIDAIRAVLGRRFERHRAADPHCTCNDCLDYHIRHTISD